MSGQNKHGTILKGVGGFYYVRDANEEIIECKACGRFRNEGVTPLPGDHVIFSVNPEGTGYIESISPRRNELRRPRVANIDMVAIVMSLHKPRPDCLLCDKLIVEAKRSSILPLLVLNKSDTATSDYAELRDQYSGVCGYLCVSAQTGNGLEALREQLKERCTCFAGQSAVGKSSILNALFPWLGLEIGGLSKKTDRGKHTTRHAELLVMSDIRGMVVDTPGFSFLESGKLEPMELQQYYDDMLAFSGHCRFTSCLHADEPECGVKYAVEKGLINKQRYQRYLTILYELKDRRSREYD